MTDRRAPALLAFGVGIALAGSAGAQSVPVFQSGLANPNDIAKFERNGSIRSGVVSGSLTDINGHGLNPFAVTDFGQPGICSDSALAIGAFNRICLGHSSSGKPRIEINALGGAISQSAEFCVDGTCQSFPPPVSTSAAHNAKTDYNCKGDGVSDDTGCLAAIFADTTSPTVFFPAGTYQLACAQTFVAASGVSISGAGRHATVIKLAPACHYAANVFSWTNLSFELSAFTLDVNNATTSGTSFIHGQASAAALMGPRVVNLGVIGAARPGRLIALNTSGSGSYSNTIVDNNYLAYTAAETSTDNCIAFGGSGNDDIPGGSFHGFSVSSNVCKNSSFQIDGDSGTVANNDISGFAFGAGIFMIFNGFTAVAPPTSDHDNIISGNVIHDSAVGYDANSTTAAGIENNCYRCIIIGNILYNLGGEGIRNYGSFTHISDNKIFDNGKTTSLFGNYLPSGINLANGGREPYQNKTITLSGNSIFDDGAHTQAFGVVFNYGSAPADGLVAIKSSNDIRGDSSLTFMVGGTPTVGTAIIDQVSPTNAEQSGLILSDWVMLSSRAVNSGETPATALGFFPIDTGTYHNFRLECRDLLTSAAVPVGIQVGTGPTPTWQVASYGVEQIWAAPSVAVTHYDNTSLAAMMIGPSNADTTGTWPTGFTATVGDLFVPRNRRIWNITATAADAGDTGPATINGVGWFDSSAALTAIRVIPVGSTFATGYCGLWGRQ